MGKRFVIRIHPSGIYSKLNMRIRFSLSHNLLNGLKLDTLQPKHVISRIESVTLTPRVVSRMAIVVTKLGDKRGQIHVNIIIQHIGKNMSLDFHDT